MDLAQTVEDFHRDGFVRVPGLLSEGELRALQHDTQRIIDGGYEDVANPTDYRTAPDPDTGKDVFNRVQFVFPLATTEPNPLLALLGHRRCWRWHTRCWAMTRCATRRRWCSSCRATAPRCRSMPTAIPPTLAPPTLTWDSTSTSTSTTRPGRTAACWRLREATWRAIRARRSRPPDSTFRDCSRFRCAPATSWFTTSGPRLPSQPERAPAPHPLLRVPVPGLDAARRGPAGCGNAHRRHLGQGADPAHAACHRDPQGVSLRGGRDSVRLPGAGGIRCRAAFR